MKIFMETKSCLILEFVRVLFNKKAVRRNVKRIQSKLHRIGRFHCLVLIIKGMY